MTRSISVLLVCALGVATAANAADSMGKKTEEQQIQALQQQLQAVQAQLKQLIEQNQALMQHQQQIDRLGRPLGWLWLAVTARIRNFTS